MATTPISRTRGMLSGLLLMLLGIWGALIPFIGPYFRYSYTPDLTWHYTSGRLWLEILPGAVTLLGGWMLLATRHRQVAMLGGLLAAVSGAWFVLGPAASTLWTGSGSAAGNPVGTTTLRVFVEEVGFFAGLGVVITFLAAAALGRLSLVSHQDVARAERQAVATGPQPVTTTSPEQLAAATTGPVAGRAVAGKVATDRAVTDRAVTDRDQSAASGPAAAADPAASQPVDQSTGWFIRPGQANRTGRLTRTGLRARTVGQSGSEADPAAASAAGDQASAATSGTATSGPASSGSAAGGSANSDSTSSR